VTDGRDDDPADGVGETEDTVEAVGSLVEADGVEVGVVVVGEDSAEVG
jgi:hypothetical protein